MIVMCQFKKGMFDPADVRSGSFDVLKEQAMEGSDYISDDDEWTLSDTLILLAMAIGFFIVPIIAFGWYFIYVWRARKKVNKDLLWYRDIPLKGDLQQANDMLNAYKYMGTDYNNLLSASILKLINMGAISIESRLNQKGKTEQNFVIHDLPDNGDVPVLLRKIHNIFKRAAGDDTVLEPRELKNFMRSSHNESITESFREYHRIVYRHPPYEDGHHPLQGQPRRGASGVRTEEVPQGVLAARRAPCGGGETVEGLYDLRHALRHCRPGDQGHEEDQS